MVEFFNNGSIGLYVRDTVCGDVIGGKFDWDVRWEDGLEGHLEIIKKNQEIYSEFRKNSNLIFI